MREQQRATLVTDLCESAKWHRKRNASAFVLRYATDGRVHNLFVRAHMLAALLASPWKSIAAAPQVLMKCRSGVGARASH